MKYYIQNNEVYWCSTEIDGSPVRAAVVLCYNSAFNDATIRKNSVSPFSGASLYAYPCLRITY